MLLAQLCQRLLRSVLMSLKIKGVQSNLNHLWMVYNTPVTLSVVSVDAGRNGAILLTRIVLLFLVRGEEWIFLKENELLCDWKMRILSLDIG